MSTSTYERIQQSFVDSAQTKLAAAEAIAEPIALAADTLVQCLMQDGKILACGNGTSAAHAQHFCAALLNRYDRERPALAAMALTGDVATLTSIANDSTYTSAYDVIFARQISALGSPGDILLAISTSGHSPNILAAVDAAHDKEMLVIALTGREGGELLERLNEFDIPICVPSESTARIHEVHALTINCLCDSIDYLLLGA